MRERIVIIGAGRTTTTLVERLARLAPLLVLDTSPVAIEALPKVFADGEASEAMFPITTRLGDGTSRFVLEEAREDPRQSVAIVAAAGDDRKNVEVCRLARELGYAPIIGIVIDQARAPDYEAVGARAIVRPTILAQVVERALRHDGLAIATTVGQGRGEIIEFNVLPGSPAIGVSLAEISPDAWRVAAIYRDGELVIPTGQTKIAAEDRLLLVGDPVILPSVAEQLRIGAPLFPLRHGKHVVVFLPDGRDRAIEVVAEALAIKTRATALLRVYPRAEPAKTVLEDEADDLPAVPSHQRLKTFEDVALQGADLPAQIEHLRRLRPGVVVVKGSARRLIDRLLGRGGALAALCNALRAPALFPRGSPHFTRVVHALAQGVGAMALADTAIDLARMLSLPLTVARVALPEYLGTRDQVTEQTLRGIERRTRLYGLRAEIVALEGNPVAELVRLAKPSDFFVIGRQRATRDSFTSPDIALRVARRAPCSVLVQTFEET